MSNLTPHHLAFGVSVNPSRLAVATTALGLILGGALSVPAAAHDTGIHDNCTNLNKTWAHGVGKRGANDRGGDVTNFKRSNKLYRIANNHNSALDGDNDGIACEKA